MTDIEEKVSEASGRSFDWATYADATFAGLSILIPVPMVDLAFEALFRRRMPRSIAARRGRRLAPEVLRALNHTEWSARGCLLLPLKLLVTLAKRIFRTILYVLTIKEATDNLSYYWQRAFLIDLGLRRGHLDDPRRAFAAVDAIEQVLDQMRTSPVETLAAEIVGSVRQVLRAAYLWARRGAETEAAREAHETMERGWQGLQAHFERVSATYDSEFAGRLAAAEALRSPAGEQGEAGG